MKLILIPDVHGRTFWKEPVQKHIDDYDKVVFLGDYLDSYPDEWKDVEHTREDDINNMLEIIDLKAKYKEKVVLLKGNHDQHYCNKIFNDLAGGTRKDRMNANRIGEIFDEFKDCFQLAYEATVNGKRILITHAGVTKSWYEQNKELIGELNAENLNKLDFSEDGQVALAQISPYRTWFGGKTGSILWSDVREFAKDESENIDGVYQIFGHTRLNGKPYATDKFACIDCSKVFAVDEEGNLRELP